MLPGARILKKCVRVAETSRKRVSHTVKATNDTGYPTPVIQFSIQPKLLTIQTIPYRYQPKETTQSRVSLRNKLRANPTKEHSKTPRSRRHERPIPPIMKNVRYKPNNPTETRTIPARTQKAKPYSELVMNDLHRNKATYIAPSPRQQ